MFFSRGLGPIGFRTFVDHLIVAFGSNRLQKTLMRKIADWVKKKKKRKEKDLLNCKCKATFLSDRCGAVSAINFFVADTVSLFFKKYTNIAPEKSSVNVIAYLCPFMSAGSIRPAKSVCINLKVDAARLSSCLFLF